MDLELRDKVVLVTGGAAGIGAAIVRSIVKEGAIAVIADRSVDSANELAEELRATGDSRLCTSSANTFPISRESATK